MKPISECRLYAFVDTAYLSGRKPETVARELCEGGADLIQLRAKDAPPAEVAKLARVLLRITQDAGVWLVVNDHWSVACEVGAPLCHLGQEDFFGAGYKHVSDLLRVGGVGVAGEPGKPDQANRPFLGLSTHAPDQAIRAMNAGAAYVAIGPVYATPTKPGARPVTLEYVRWAAQHCTVPWFAIGGINLSNLEDVLAAGASRVCVVSAILKAPDVRGACRAFKERLLSWPNSQRKNLG